VIGAAWVESGAAQWALIAGVKVLGDAERAVAVAAANGLVVEFGAGPHNRWVAHCFLVALNAGVELLTALEFNGDDVALGMVMDALGPLIYPSAVANDDGFRLHC
jgi:hypothetical protein